MASSSSGWNRRSSWEDREYAEPADVQSSDDEPPTAENLTQEESSLEFFNYVVHLKMSGILSAKQACILSYWAKGGGLSEPGSSLALPPQRVGGAFSKHFDKVVGIDLEMNSEYYELNMPSIQRFSLGRCVSVCAASMVHKTLKQEIDGTPHFFDDVAAGGDKFWGPVLRKHELSRAGNKRVVPLGLYFDAVPFLKRDSALAFWFINLCSTKRHVALVLRKREFCTCGCFGWCTLLAAFQYLQWLMSAMASGTFPGRRHDGLEWAEDDPNKALAGKPLGYSAAVLVVKADWEAFSNTMGYPTWSHHRHPCFACNCFGGEGGNMNQVQGISPVGLPWAAKGAAEYRAACEKAEVLVNLQNKGQLQTLLGHLRFDPRRSGSRGRAMTADLAEFGLLKGDRLEPCPLHPDIMIEDRQLEFPARLLFWRVSEEGLTKHRNPIFEPNTLLTPSALCIDEMHTMHLGVFQVYTLGVLWRVIEADAFHLGSGLGDEAGHARTALRLRRELFDWYADQKRRFPEKPVYELADFNLKVLGSKAKPHLTAKAAESGSLLEFSVDICRRFQHALPQGAALLKAGEALVSYLRITRSAGERMNVRERQGLFDAVVTFLTLRETAGLPWKPKMHLMVHLAHQAGRFGNPLAVATWHDESLNRSLASVCRTAHAAVWHKRVLATFRHSAGPDTREAKKRRQ